MNSLVKPEDIRILMLGPGEGGVSKAYRKRVELVEFLHGSGFPNTWTMEQWEEEHPPEPYKDIRERLKALAPQFHLIIVLNEGPAPLVESVNLDHWDVQYRRKVAILSPFRFIRLENRTVPAEAIRRFPICFPYSPKDFRDCQLRVRCLEWAKCFSDFERDDFKKRVARLQTF